MHAVLAVYVAHWLRPTNAICKYHRQAILRMIASSPGAFDAHEFILRNPWVSHFATARGLARVKSELNA